MAEDISREADYDISMTDLSTGSSEFSIIQNFGYRGISISALPARIKTGLIRHRKSDSIIYIHKETLNNVMDLVKKIVLKLDQK